MGSRSAEGSPCDCHKVCGMYALSGRSMSHPIDLMMERARMSFRKWRTKFHANLLYRWDGMFSFYLILSPQVPPTGVNM